MTQTICGVDVAAQTLDARIGPDGVVRTFPNTPKGCAALARFCQAHHVALTVGCRLAALTTGSSRPSPRTRGEGVQRHLR